MKSISLAICLAALSLVSGNDASPRPTEAPLMMSSPKPTMAPRVVVAPTKAPMTNSPPRRLVYKKLPEQTMETKMTDMDTSKDTMRTGMPIDMKGEVLTADVRVTDMKPVQVSGFITKNGNIYEIEDKHGIGMIEGRQNSEESSHVCNYGSIVIYSDVPCDEVTNVSVDGVPAGLKGDKPAEEQPKPQPEQPVEQQQQQTQQPEQTQQPAQNAEASTDNAQLSQNEVAENENEDLDNFDANEHRGQNPNRRRPNRNRNSNKRRNGNRNRNRNRNGVKKNGNRKRSGQNSNNRRQKPNRGVVYQDDYDDRPTRNQNKRKKTQQQRRKQEIKRRRQQQELEELDEFDDDDYEDELEQRRRRKNKNRRNQKRRNNQQYELNDWRDQEYERGRAISSGTVLLIQEKK